MSRSAFWLLWGRVVFVEQGGFYGFGVVFVGLVSFCGVGVRRVPEEAFVLSVPMVDDGSMVDDGRLKRETLTIPQEER